MTTEEKAKAYADQPTTYKTWGIHRQALIDAYLAGAAEALRSQWKDAAKELPKPEQDVFVATNANTIEKYGFAWLSTISNGTLRWYSNNDNLDLDDIRFWLPIPPLPNTEEQ